ncbi:MAG: DUF1456 family protein [Candidatus Cloacimonetes bacterium]|nr:DUF1456 family protein [Candidatus Cloacimonadota bacterium]
MINNDIIRRLIYILDFDKQQALKMFTLSGTSIDEGKLNLLVTRENDPNFELCSDLLLNYFLDGVIIHKRGLPDSNILPKPCDRLNNNIILRKVKIAFTFKDTDIISCLKVVDFKVGKSELSALFRKPGHKHYKVCGDQFLRNFLLGLSKTLRP